MRRAKILPTYCVNGWRIDKMPNTFAERFVYEAYAVDVMGYTTAKHGFQTLTAARAFCADKCIS